MRVALFKILILFCVSFPLTAKSDTWDFAMPHKKRCSLVSKDEQNMKELNICISKEYSSSEARLNKIYKKLHAALKDSRQLQKVQQKWLAFRDAQCKFMIPGSGESGIEYRYSLNACLIDLTEKRILDLENIYPCNGCIEFKEQFYKEGTWPRMDIPAVKADAPPRQP